MGDGAQGAQFADACGESGQARGIGDVEDERFDDGPLPGGGQVLGGRGHGRLVPVDEEQPVHLVGEPPRAGQTHPAAGAGDDPDGRHALIPQNRSRLYWATRLTSSTR